MAKRNPPAAVFDSAAELFAVLATPIRLQIINALGDGEKNVSQLLAEVPTTQPNMSNHLLTLARAGLLARRRQGTQIFYRIQSERAALLCSAVCQQMAVELFHKTDLPSAQRLRPAPPRESRRTRVAIERV